MYGGTSLLWALSGVIPLNDIMGELSQWLFVMILLSVKVVANCCSSLCLEDLKVATRVHNKKTPFAHKHFQFLKLKEGKKRASPFPDPFPASSPPYLLLYTPSFG